MKKHDIVISEMGVETRNNTVAADRLRQGGDFRKNTILQQSLFMELAGQQKCWRNLLFTFSTPASSFFVPIVENRGKSLKTFTVGGRFMPYARIAEELRTAVRCSRRVALRATKGMTANRKKDFNRIYAETLTANVLTIAEETEELFPNGVNGGNGANGEYGRKAVAK